MMRVKGAFIFLVFILAFAVLFVQLGLIIWRDGESFRKKVLTQAIQREGDKRLSFKRGDILDRNGIVLAGTTPIYNLIFDGALINSLKKEEREFTLNLLAEQNIRTKPELVDLLEEKKNSKHYIIKKNMRFHEIEKIKSAIDKREAKGIFYEMKYRREYPYPTLASELIGFTKSDSEGEGGLEQFYNNILIGEEGRKYGVLNNKSIATDQEVSAQDGYRLMLNIDYSIQKYITDAMKDYLKDHNPRSVTIVVADPRDMSILGMKSYPSFSQNSPFEIDGKVFPAEQDVAKKMVEGEINRLKLNKIEEIRAEAEKKGLTVIDAKTKAAMEEEAKKKAANSNNEQGNQTADLSIFVLPTVEEIAENEVITAEEKEELHQKFLIENRWKNIALTNGYEPGSIFKAVTYAVAAEEDRINAENYYYCPGGTQVANYFIRCHRHSGHGAETAEQGLSNSCNVVFMEMGFKIGRELFYNYQHKFGFGALTGIDLSGETSQRKNIYSKEQLNEVQLATSSFGQGFNVTPIQMITAFSALINGGYLYEPHIVKKIFDANGNLFEVKDKSLIRQVVSEATSIQVRRALRGVVDEGTGRTARIAGYEIGGKTATSEKQPRGNGKYTVSFIGFAPIENPEVVTLVIVDEPEGAYQDSRIPALIFRNCMENIMPYLHIFKAEAPEEEKKKQEGQ